MLICDIIKLSIYLKGGFIMLDLTVLDIIRNAQYDDEVLAIIELLEVYKARGFDVSLELDEAKSKLEELS